MPYKILEATEREQKYIIDQLVHFNLERAPLGTDYYNIPIALSFKEDGKILGGLMGKIYRSCLTVDILWVDEKFRKKGIGLKLMQRAERIAIDESCRFIHLDTFSFQALGFYQKLGFEIFGVLDGYPDDIKRYYLKKNLMDVI